MNIEQDFQLVKTYPLMHINMVLAEQLESVQGLRPYSEIANNVKKAIEVTLDNPVNDYQRLEKLGQGA